MTVELINPIAIEQGTWLFVNGRTIGAGVVSKKS